MTGTNSAAPARRQGGRMAPAGRLGVAELVVLVSALLVMLAGFLYQLNAEREEAAKGFAHRVRMAETYLHSRLQAVDALAAQFRERYGDGAHAFEPRLRPSTEHKVWVLAGAVRDGVASQPRGTATGLGVPPSRELAAALALDAGAASVLAYDKEVPRVYYLSASHFIYHLPAVAPRDFHFSNELYGKPYWTASLPARNADGAQVVSSLHAETGSPGRVITLASPVSVNKRFLGLVALDLGQDVLRGLVARDGTAGEAVLVDRSGRIVAREGRFGLHETWPLPPQGERHWRDDEGTEWQVAPLAGGQLVMLQRLSTVGLLNAAARSSVPVGLLFVLTALVVILMLRLRAAMAELAQQVRRDPLTHALNRRGLYEDAEVIRALARRSRKPLAVVMFDLDFFKKVNDLHGHERGDKVLCALVRGLQKQARDYDVICRWGGEEFVALLLLEAPGDAIPVAERLRGVAANACLREALTLVTISGGMAMWQDGEKLDAAIGRADDCLYAAKQGGRDRLEVAPEVKAATD